MTEQISDRLLDQRFRNRMMEELLGLVEWEGALAWGTGEYFNSFFDFFPDEPSPHPNSALTDDERTVLSEVIALMDKAASSTPQQVTEADLIASGWPERIKPVAQKVLASMMLRGRFSEEVEEATPPPRCLGRRAANHPFPTFRRAHGACRGSSLIRHLDRRSTAARDDFVQIESSCQPFDWLQGRRSG